MRRDMDDARADRWEPWPLPKSNLSGGPVRVEDEPHPDYRPRPVGFTASRDVQIPRAPGEPLLWDGDQA